MNARAKFVRLVPALLVGMVNISAVVRKPPAPVALAWPPSGASCRVEYIQSISSPGDLAIHSGFLSKLATVVFGPSEKPNKLVRPFAIASDSTGRIAVTDPGMGAVHLLDPGRNRHKVVQGSGRERFRSPIGLDFDRGGNLYVADSVLGKIFVFAKDGGFRHCIGEVRREGLFKRPTGLAVERSSGRIFLTDTLRHKVYVLDASGKIESEWGRRGEGPGEFNFPTDVALGGDDRVFVLDAMNFRVQIFTRSGQYVSSFGKPANEPGGFFRPKGIAVDESSRLVYVADAMFQVVQAFSFEGKLAFAWGHDGSAPGEFRLPAGLCVQPGGRLLVADSYNNRIQVFRSLELRPAGQGGTW